MALVSQFAHAYREIQKCVWARKGPEQKSNQKQRKDETVFNNKPKFSFNYGLTSVVAYQAVIISPSFISLYTSAEQSSTVISAGNLFPVS
jgi:hypothetical protein